MSDSTSDAAASPVHWSDVLDRSHEERRELALALLNRADRVEAAMKAFRAAYPWAPEEMVYTATHHVYVDGPGAAVDWLADAELFLRNPDHRLGYGASYHLLYHVYNWHQFQRLLYDSREEIPGLLSELREFAAEGDLEAVKKTVEMLADAIGGTQNPPDFE